MIDGTHTAKEYSAQGTPGFEVHFNCVSGTATYTFVAKTPMKIVDFGGYMTGAGAASDTVQVKDGSDNAITEAIDLSALADKVRFACATIDDAYNTIQTGQVVKIVTASDATAKVWFRAVKLR